MSKEKTKFRIFKETLNNNTEKFYPQVFDLDRNGWLFLHEGEGGVVRKTASFCKLRRGYQNIKKLPGAKT